MSNKPKRPVLSPTAEESMVYPFSEEEYRRGIATLKNNKAAGIDYVLVEQLKNLGSKTHKWLLAMLNNFFTQIKIPPIWRKSKIITIIKPGKISTPKSWGPTEGSCSMAVPAMSTKPRTSALRMPSTHAAIRNANHR